MQVANNPLFIEDKSSGANEVKRGTTTKRRVAVKNLGDKKADIDIWIAATDEKSEPLLSWCVFNESNPLKLEPKESKEVILTFEVPQQATPDLYNYEILIEAQSQYPDKVFRRPQQLRVLRSDQDAEWGSEPTFTLQPFTNSANPYLLKAGEQLNIKVIVENRSKRVDRFYLTCPELTPDWFTVHYPESRLELSGLVKETDGLELLPNSTGEITLFLHPPQYTLAGNYFPTIRLISSNKEDLVLLDVVYLQILPDESLKVELNPLLLKIPSQPGIFEVKLFNQGNIRREIVIFASDREEIFTYIPEISPVELLPGYVNNIPLKVQPRKWWNRPLWGKAKEFNFNLELENHRLLVLPETAKPPALPKELVQGKLIWEPRPWWQFLLPLFLLILLALGIISIGAFLLWQQMLVKPKIDTLKPVSNIYAEINKQPVSLNFQISNWQFINWKFQNTNRLKSIKIIPQSGEGVGEIISYEYNELKKLCPESPKGDLNCTVPTKTTTAGAYTFKVELYSPGQNQHSDSKETDTVTIKAIAKPKIINLFASKKTYQEALKERVILNWRIANANQLKTLTLTQQGGNEPPVKKTFIKCIPQEFQPQNLQLQPNSQDILICQGVATEATKAGSYTFKLEAFSQQDQTQPSDSKETDTVTIKPIATPKIINLSASKKTYQEALKERVILNWIIANASQLKTLTLTQQGGKEPPVKKTFIKCIPQEFQPQNLQLQPNVNNFQDILICQAVATDATKAGTYTFKLEAFSQQDQTQPSDSKETDTITIRPAPPIPPIPIPKIEELSLNKTSYEAKEPVLLNLKISNPSQIKEVKLIEQGSDGSVTKNTFDLRQCNFQETSSQNLKQNNSAKIAPVNNLSILNCQNIRLTPTKAGKYTFKFEVFSRTDQNQPAHVKETNTITVKPLPVPKIADLSSTQPFYEAAKNEQILLNWEITNASNIKELTLVGLALDGSIASPLKRYPINNLPTGCTLTTNLVCKNVPTDGRQSGDYVFKLTVIPQEEAPETEITKNTPTIKIKPIPPKPPKPATPVNIVYFKVNGRDVNQEGKIIFPINKERKQANVILSWKVEEGEDIKVELLGSNVQPQGDLSYPLSKPPSSQTITLKVRNKAGEEKTQSVVIETVEPSSSTKPQTSSPGTSSPGIVSPGTGVSPGTTSPGTASPSPSNVEQLPPIEVPPLPD
ncbi:hypothetical protein [Floridanema aerugineum]|uniref:Uncharacterized protein n=1 Tax=Floridaenema aerugineum BLCC-F46 TaxID=3153654 RepID=A0ABV4X4A3_9CYAN